MLIELVVSSGDPQGIGPEVSVRAARALAARAPADLGIVLVGDAGVLGAAGGGDLSEVGPAPRPGLARLTVPLARPLDAPPPSRAGGRASLDVLEAALARVLGGPGRALVTAPLSKQAVSSCGVSFAGHTGWLGERLGTPEPVMLFVADTLRVALATVHLPLRQVADSITVEGLVQTLKTLDEGLRTRFRLLRPALAVLGLNPHAGEGGLLGDEERTVIVPALERFRAEGGRASGPWSADSFFSTPASEAADAVLALYHDQGLLPLKARAFGRAVNVTLGLPIVRTSVDHGCAYDLQGTGRADWGSMTAALDLARELLAEGR